MKNIFKKVVTAIMVFTLLTPALGAPIAYAENEPNESIEIVSVKQFGVELNKLFDESLQEYYYEVPKGNSIVSVVAKITGMTDDVRYYFGQTPVDSSDNGKEIKYADIIPMRQQDSYHIISLRDENGNTCASKNLRLKSLTDGTEHISITSVTQNGIQLQKENGNFVVTDYKAPITINYTLENLIIGWEYQIRFNNQNTETFVADNTTKMTTGTFAIDPTSDTTSFAYISLYGQDLNNLLHSSSDCLQCNFNISDPNFHAIGIFRINSVKQGGNEILPEQNTISLNDIQNISINLSAQNAIDDYEYTIQANINRFSSYSHESSEKKLTVTGQELKNSINIELSPLEHSTDMAHITISVYSGNGGSSPKTTYFKDTYDLPQLLFIEDSSIPRIDIDTITYTNNKNEPISITNNWGIISPKYHDKNNSLTLELHGNYFTDDSQQASIEIIHGNSLVYTKQIEKQYAELNSNFSIELPDFTMRLPSYEEIVSSNNDEEYKIILNCNGNKKEAFTLFYSYGNDIDSVVIHNNGQANVSQASMGGASPYMVSKSSSINKNSLDNSNNVNIVYITKNYIENKEYTYEMYYTDNDTYNMYEHLTDSEIIATGKITGKELNDGMLNFKIINKNNYRRPAYVLILKDGDKITNIVLDTLNLWEGAGLLSSEIKSTENIYLQLHDTYYYVPKENSVDIFLTGVDFENGKNYNVISTNGTMEICQTEEPPHTPGLSYSLRDGLYCIYSQTNVLDSTQTVKGSDLNNGEVSIKIPFSNKIKDASYISLQITVTDETGTMYPGASITINYKDTNDILTSNAGYRVDNLTNTLKGISKNTILGDFVNSMSVSDSGHINIYNENGEEVKNGNIGTGMKIKIMDKYNRPIADVNTVVTGDVNGDGDISPTDLARERQHISGIRELTGAYKIAGSTNGDNEITLTDLARMRQDVAGIREMR